MSLPAPNLDDRRFQDIVDEAKRRIARYCPEWTDHNVSDPGVVLIELFAWMTEMLLYRLNQVPDRLYVKFLELVGIELASVSPARTDLLFTLAAPPERPIRVPAGTRVVADARRDRRGRRRRRRRRAPRRAGAGRAARRQHRRAGAGVRGAPGSGAAAPLRRDRAGGSGAPGGRRRARGRAVDRGRGLLRRLARGHRVHLVRRHRRDPVRAAGDRPRRPGPAIRRGARGGRADLGHRLPVRRRAHRGRRGPAGARWRPVSTDHGATTVGADGTFLVPGESGDEVRVEGAVVGRVGDAGAVR